jgi:hypothetical protein
MNSHAPAPESLRVSDFLTRFHHKYQGRGATEAKAVLS